RSVPCVRQRARLRKQCFTINIGEIILVVLGCVRGPPSQTSCPAVVPEARQERPAARRCEEGRRAPQARAASERAAQEAARARRASATTRSNTCSTTFGATAKIAAASLAPGSSIRTLAPSALAAGASSPAPVSCSARRRVTSAYRPRGRKPGCFALVGLSEAR